MEKEDKEMRDWLVEMYIEKEMSFTQIEKNTGVSRTNLHRLFRKYGIATRTIKRAMKIWWKGRKKNSIG